VLKRKVGYYEEEGQEEEETRAKMKRMSIGSPTMS
jgi:hypothetical protein